jgi:tetraprenyl-beta-curcumene synthase
LRGVSREVSRWRARAQAIPDRSMRADALGAIARKRGNINGAALFWTLPRARDGRLQRVLVAYNMIADFLDNVSERNADAGLANGLHLHVALAEALGSSVKMSDYYRHNRRGTDDGGYLRALVKACREGCRTLPAFELICPLAIRAATLAQVLGLNHERDPRRRDLALMVWATRWFPGESALSWYELAAAASGWLAVLALLALASERDCDADYAAATFATYFPWVSLAGTMLDSYADAAEDAACGDHSYVAHYASEEVARARVCELVARAAGRARSLPNGVRHGVIVACMIALYLSKDSVHAAGEREHAGRLLDAGGPLAKLLLPILRVWRTIYAQRSH